MLKKTVVFATAYDEDSEPIGEYLITEYVLFGVLIYVKQIDKRATQAFNQSWKAV